LRDLGVDISKRQVVRLLTAGQDGFLDENPAVLRAGLETASWITVDDTGARHADRNGICTRIGNQRFAWFATTFSKSRRNFLELLRAGFEDYVINVAALAYMGGRNLSGPVSALMAEHESKRFADQAAWTAHLEGLGIAALKVHPDPVKIATEGALWGSIVERGWLTDTVILSDDAGQFNVGRHALCWVHAERLVHKLDSFSERQRRAKERIQARIWWLYADLKAYCRDPTPGARRALRMRFDRLFKTRYRLCHPGPASGAAACQPRRTPHGVGPSRRAPAHQRRRERHPLPGHAAQDLRRNQVGRRPRCPRCLPWPDEDLRQTRHPLLGLSRLPPRRSRRAARRPAAPAYPPSRLDLNAPPFAPVTKNRVKLLNSLLLQRNTWSPKSGNI